MRLLGMMDLFTELGLDEAKPRLILVQALLDGT